VCVPTSTPPVPAGQKGAGSNHTNPRGEPDDHALGRSRGGFTTKIHALTDTCCRLLTVLLSAGQAGDNPMLPVLITRHRLYDRRRFRLLADKAYSHPSTRRLLRTLRIPHTIPERIDQAQHRRTRRGGRPPGFDTNLYAQRNTIERGFGRIKQWRGIATRYDKYAITYLGGVLLAAAVLNHRTQI
jgi:putative transposase